MLQINITEIWVVEALLPTFYYKTTYKVKNISIKTKKYYIINHKNLHTSAYKNVWDKTYIPKLILLSLLFTAISF